MEGIKGKVSWLNPGVLEGAARTLIKWLMSAGMAGGARRAPKTQGADPKGVHPERVGAGRSPVLRVHPGWGGGRRG